MSKAALIMDMPESCMGCNLMYIDGENNLESCQAYEEARPVNLEEYDKPDWCPLVEIPFAVNDSVYLLKDQRIFEAFVYEIHILISKRMVFKTVIAEDTPDGCYARVNEFSSDNIGETVFLTREEAEARLKELETT